MVINFADDAGHIVDSYITSVASDKLDTQTSQSSAGQSSPIKIQVINPDLILLTHTDSKLLYNNYITYLYYCTFDFHELTQA